MKLDGLFNKWIMKNYITYWTNIVTHVEDESLSSRDVWLSTVTVTRYIATLANLANRRIDELPKFPRCPDRDFIFLSLAPFLSRLDGSSLKIQGVWMLNQIVGWGPTSRIKSIEEDLWAARAAWTNRTTFLAWLTSSIFGQRVHSYNKVPNLPNIPILNVHVWQSLFRAMWRRMVSPTCWMKLHAGLAMLLEQEELTQ